MSLTKKQAEILAFIKEHIADKDYAPSYREIAEHFGLSSPATVHQHVQALAEKGMVSLGEDGTARSIELIEKQPLDPFSIMLPLAGLITAGVPIEAIEENETIAVPAQFVVDGLNSYVLRVKGQSMIEEGIFDGDYVVVERNPSPKNGDVVVALLDNAYATLKKFFRETGRIRLQPANSALKPIFVKDVIIQGVVRAVIRKYSVS